MINLSSFNFSIPNFKSSKINKIEIELINLSFLGNSRPNFKLRWRTNHYLIFHCQIWNIYIIINKINTKQTNVYIINLIYNLKLFFIKPFNSEETII